MLCICRQLPLVHSMTLIIAVFNVPFYPSWCNVPTLSMTLSLSQQIIKHPPHFLVWVISLYSLILTCYYYLEFTCINSLLAQHCFSCFLGGFVVYWQRKGICLVVCTVPLLWSYCQISLYRLLVHQLFVPIPSWLWSRWCTQLWSLAASPSCLLTWVGEVEASKLLTNVIF